MTSPPPNFLASAKPSSEAEQTARTDEAARVLAQFPHQPRQTVSTAENTTVYSSSALSESSQVSLAYDPIYYPGNATPAVPRWPQERSSRPTKRAASPTEFRWQKSRRDSQGAHQPSDAPRAPDEPALPDRGQGSSRAPAPLSAMPRATLQGREPPVQSAKRPPGRPLKYARPEKKTESPLSPGRDDDGDRVISPSSAPTRPSPPVHHPAGASSSTAPWYSVPGGLPLAASKAAASPPRSTGTSSELSNYPQALLRPQLADRSLRLPFPDAMDAPRGSIDYPTGQRMYFKPEAPSDASSPTHPRRLVLPSRFGPTETRLHESFPRPVPAQAPNSADTDGFRILRNAVPVALVRELNSVVARGLPVTEGSPTHEAYAAPLQAYVLRDAFNSVSLTHTVYAYSWLTVQHCRDALQEFYTPVKNKMPPMPKNSVVGRFLSGSPTKAIYSVLHVGHKEELYVHIALNRLCSQSGFFNLLKGSHISKHPSRTPVAGWARADFELEEGDAIIWRGDLSYLLSSRGGGKSFFHHVAALLQLLIPIQVDGCA